MVFDNLLAGTYSIQILDGEDLITTQSNIIVGVEPLPTPTVDITDVVINDTTGAGNNDGTATANVNISNFTGQGTAVISPDPNSVSPINLTDGNNSLSFTDLPAGDYQVDIKDDDDIIDSFTFTIADYVPPTGDIGNIVPTSPTTEGGTDGSISFDVNSTGCTGTSTAVLNPASGTTPITLTDGNNTGLTFSPLPAGDYTVQIYCDETLVNESDTITIPDFVPPATATISNVVPTDTTTSGGTDGTITFDVEIANFTDSPTAVLNPATGTTAITLVDGANTGLIFNTLPAGTYTIEVYNGSSLITSQASIIINDPTPSGRDFIPLTPESDDANSKTSGEIADSYLNYDIILSKNQHPNYVGNGLFIGKEIDINDLNQSGITGNNQIQKLIFTDTTNFNLDITGSDFTGIYYLKGINVGLTPLILEGTYENNDSFTWLEDITQYNMIIQKWWDNARNTFSYTLWEQTTTPSQNYIYVAKNAADTALDGWRLSDQQVSTGVGEGSYLTIIYGFNFTSIDNIVASQTSNTFTLNDYTSYDLLLFKIEGSNFAVGDWVIKVSDIVADGITQHSYSNYQQEHFTITGNVLTWTSGGGLGHLELLGVKGIIL